MLIWTYDEHGGYYDHVAPPVAVTPNANSLFDMMDLRAEPAFPRPPTLAAAGDPTARASCLSTGPGVIPPSSTVIPA